MNPEPGYELVRVRSGAWGVRHRGYDEVWHPGVGPAAEAAALYVEGLDLRTRMRLEDPGEPFVVWDVGLGGAGNASTVLRAAVECGRAMRLVSFDRTLAGLEFALAHAEDLGYLQGWTCAAHELVGTGGAAVRWRDGVSLEWRCVLGDFPRLLGSDEAASWPIPHAILFDPHSPQANPEMWTLGVFEGMARRLTSWRATSLATYSRATSVRVALLLAGFYVGVGAGTAFKEESTMAANRPDLIRQPLGERWLERARRSGAAEPWRERPFAARPLTAETWEALCRHPQMRRAGPR